LYIGGQFAREWILQGVKGNFPPKKTMYIKIRDLFTKQTYRKKKMATNKLVSVVVSEENAVGSSSFGSGVFKLTHLEVGFGFLDLGLS
jgi:hypothetical protein